MAFILIVGAVLLFLPTPGKAQGLKGITLPPYHWMQDYFFEWQLRHPSKDLFVTTLPLQFSQLQPLVTQKPTSPFERFLLTQFRTDLESFAPSRKESDSETILYFGTRLVERAGRMVDEMRSRLAWRFFSGLSLSKHVEIHNVVNLDQNLKDDPEYLGKIWRGLTAINEQAYILFHFNTFSIKFGRDYIRWGRGIDATLTVSDASRPFDQLQFQLRTEKAQFTYFASKLNTVSLSPQWQEKLKSPWAERYMTGGRGELALFDHRLQLAATQMVVWGGRDPEWYFLNPFIFYYGELVNEPDSLRGNILGSVELLYYPVPGIEVYGTLMIDDIQVEKTGPGDLEPNEIAWMVGGRVADPLGTDGLSLGIEYTRVANRTYNTLPEAEKFVHRNKPVGHFLGNDFDRWLLHARKYLGRHMLLSLTVDLRRRGEGRVNQPFDQPWMNYTVEEGYSEPFPSGIVERSRMITFDWRWHPRAPFFASLTARWQKAKNYQNVEGKTLNRFEVFINLWWEAQWFFKI